jgi:hypothetical protein
VVEENWFKEDGGGRKRKEKTCGWPHFCLPNNAKQVDFEEFRIFGDLGLGLPLGVH